MIEKESDFSEEFLTFTLPFSQPPARLDKVLATLMPEHSRSRLQTWIESGHVSVNKQTARIRQRVGPGDVLQIWPQPSQESQAYMPEDIPLDIIAESSDWLVVNKPAGLVTHPGAGNWQGTLLNGLLYHYPELRGLARAGIVHRLDKDTSGLLVVARNERSQTNLVRQLQAHTVGRYYHALVQGTIKQSGTIDLPVGRDRHVPVRMSTRNPVAPKTAFTFYRPYRQGMLGQQEVSEVVCQLKTGRTHQIRVHMASLGHPLLGDSLYGGQTSSLLSRQMLHARFLEFIEIDGQTHRQFQAPWPDDFITVCSEIWP